MVIRFINRRWKIASILIRSWNRQRNRISWQRKQQAGPTSLIS